MPRKPRVMSLEVDGKIINIYDKDLAKEIVLNILKTEKEIVSNPSKHSKQIIYNNIVTVSKPKLAKLKPINTENLPSFIKNNPWLDVLAKRK